MNGWLCYKKKMLPKTPKSLATRDGENLLGGSAGVDELAVVVNEALDLALALEVADGDAGERAVDLHAVNQRRLRNHLERRHLLQDAVVRRSVKNHHVLGLSSPTSSSRRREKKGVSKGSKSEG